MYKDYINKLKEKWVGKRVIYQDKIYNVVDVDYNGGILIDRPQYYCESYTATTTSVNEYAIREA